MGNGWILIPYNRMEIIYKLKKIFTFTIFKINPNDGMKQNYVSLEQQIKMQFLK